ncbi:bifunctional UDP-N-acetylglucosamine diphosphorylase/glucosamine-1-phosphate N-acetyltransferase GlmU [Chitinasiproducens palmae]|uniref:Bifunctional protein GlmU n=1 Tax=Chitinasiproducens palmae TaxID=1770053 RepID=A0A1H2PTB2_9BURK|nr:bifunctional UDP-N-acetylglucosamine diphosphorylase/glucosamine-1-phosphate N-acetyltransferase GlmU [Chitinasiproducens palmae]SDV50341.1 bifunctional UDP-N-acetylglucosamine pyrophosphorylase / Glucosamine-1-phosphate N-acetyltransferase [Chitinasiproducens palmae]
MNIVILAAGSGKRMRSSLPKVLHPLAGQPLLSHVIDTARALSPGRIVVVVGHGGEQVRAAVAADDIRFVEQREQLGTGHALLQAVPLLDPAQPTLVLYGDVPLTEAATLADLNERAAAAGGPHDYGYAILTVELDDPTGYGRIVRDASGAVRAIVEQKDADAEQRAIREVNTGIVAMPTVPLAAWLASLDNRNAQGEFYLTDVVGRALADGVPVVTASAAGVEETLGVNSRMQLAQLERAYQMRQANRLLEAGVSLRDPARVDVRGELICGRDVAIDVNVVFEGRVELADGVSIGPNCVLRDVVVGLDTRIDAFSHLERARIGARAVIGPYARLRPGAQLADEVHIGNFVEVKQASIGHGSKANHLSYIGDARIGSGVNIGAGTITCNYDGANKHLTIIEDDAFVGSDTQLVAPVSVGRGATIAAGTTVWRDVEAGALALNGKTQTARAGYARPSKKKS